MSHKKLGSKLAAYSLAAGAAVGLAGTAKGALVDASVAVFEGPWFDGCPEFAYGFYDLILLKLDGSVLVDDANIDPTLPTTNAIEFVHNGTFVWGDGKSRDAINVVAHSGAGVMGGFWSSTPEGAKLGYSADISSAQSFHSGNVEVGLYGYGWYGCVGPWSGGGHGYLGMYIDSGSDRHYGWAEVTLGGGRNELTLHRFAFETTPGEGILAGETPEPMTLSLLAMGAAGVLARRKR